MPKAVSLLFAMGCERLVADRYAGWAKVDIEV